MSDNNCGIQTKPEPKEKTTEQKHEEKDDKRNCESGCLMVDSGGPGVEREE
jgi:hypothetical protein